MFMFILNSLNNKELEKHQTSINYILEIVRRDNFSKINFTEIK